jgi:hypothetical protein
MPDAGTLGLEPSLEFHQSRQEQTFQEIAAIEFDSGFVVTRVHLVSEGGDITPHHLGINPDEAVAVLENRSIATDFICNTVRLRPSGSDTVPYATKLVPSPDPFQAKTAPARCLVGEVCPVWA